MIPFIVPPLTGATALVTRPLPQANALAQAIADRGGEGIVFPALSIEPLSAPAPDAHDWLVFASVHAVEFGAPLVKTTATTRIAAIGKATAAALEKAMLPAAIVPPAPYTSEALLAHEEFRPAPGESVLIVRGAGGREMLRETLSAAGVVVRTLDVYRRVLPNVTPQAVAELEERWAQDGIDAVTATSAQTYKHLLELLSPRGRELLNATALLAPTRRILDAASETGWHGEGLVTHGADDAAIVGTLARWYARARDR